MKKKLLEVYIPVCLILSLIAIAIGGCAAPAPAPAPAPVPKTYEWKLGQPATEPSLQFDRCEELVRRIEAASDGRIKITHYPGDLLGDYVKQQEAVAAGQQELCIGWLSTKVAGPAADIRAVGFLYDSLDNYAKGFQTWQTDLMQQECEKVIDWKFLGDYPNAMTCTLSNKKFEPVPGPKNMQLRVFSLRTVQLRFEALGFNTVTIAYPEVPTSLKLGTVDGTGAASWFEAWNRYRDVIKYAYDLGSQATGASLLMNGTLFNSLSQEDQDMLVRVCKEWTAENYPLVIAKNEDYQKQLADFGVEIIRLTDEQRKACAKAARAAEWPVLEESLGKEVFDVIRAQAFTVD